MIAQSKNKYANIMNPDILHIRKTFFSFKEVYASKSSS